MDELKSRLPEDKIVVLDKTVEITNEMMQSSELITSEWKGYKFPLGLLASTAKYAYEEWEGLGNDAVFVVSFPKTGTNWALEIMRQILCIPSPESDKVFRSIPYPLLFLEAGPETVEDAGPLKLLLSFPYLLKVIHVARNPKDQLVSHFLFAKKFECAQQDPTLNWLSNWDDFFPRVIKGEIPFATKDGEWYLDHFLGWYRTLAEDGNRLLIFYEEMKKDLPSAVRKMSEFVGVRLSDDDVSEVSQRCQIENMKNRAKAGEAELNKLHNEFGILRKGAVGEWKRYFSVAQSEMLDRLVEEKLGHLGINFIYEL